MLCSVYTAREIQGSAVLGVSSLDTIQSLLLGPKDYTLSHFNWGVQTTQSFFSAASCRKKRVPAFLAPTLSLLQWMLLHQSQCLQIMPFFPRGNMIVSVLSYFSAAPHVLLLLCDKNCSVASQATTLNCVWEEMSGPLFILVWKFQVK